MNVQDIEDIRIIGVIGAGQMGGGIAQLAAQHGFRTLVTDVNIEIAARAKDKIADILEIPEGTVNSRLAEGLAQLTRILEPQFDERRGRPIQSEAQLGHYKSHGCVRQRLSDAQLLWDWAPIGTPVVVVP